MLFRQCDLWVFFVQLNFCCDQCMLLQCMPISGVWRFFSFLADLLEPDWSLKGSFEVSGNTQTSPQQGPGAGHIGPRPKQEMPKMSQEVHKKQPSVGTGPSEGWKAAPKPQQRPTWLQNTPRVHQNRPKRIRGGPNRPSPPQDSPRTLHSRNT